MTDDTRFPLPQASSLAHHWDLDPEIIFLNHGSFGACPRAVLARQAELRRQMEEEPVRFFVRELAPLLHQARQDLATFLGADPEGLAYPAAAPGSHLGPALQHRGAVSPIGIGTHQEGINPSPTIRTASSGFFLARERQNTWEANLRADS